MEELWKPINGYEGAYEISESGTVRSIDRYVSHGRGVLFVPGRIKKTCVDRDGYEYVTLSNDGRQKRFLVHRLVYESFVGHIPHGFEIDHINFDRRDNRRENLRAVSHSENVAHTVRHGRNYTSKVDTSGCNNPNYGNRSLSSKYRDNPSLAAEKQSRPGAKNGRCVPVIMVDKDGHQRSFPYIRSCATFLSASDPSVGDASIEWVSYRISQSIKTGRKYLGFTFLKDQTTSCQSLPETGGQV